MTGGVLRDYHKIPGGVGVLEAGGKVLDGRHMLDLFTVTQYEVVAWSIKFLQMVKYADVSWNPT